MVKILNLLKKKFHAKRFFKILLKLLGWKLRDKHFFKILIKLLEWLIQAEHFFKILFKLVEWLLKRIHAKRVLKYYLNGWKSKSMTKHFLPNLWMVTLAGHSTLMDSPRVGASTYNSISNLYILIINFEYLYILITNFEYL